MSLKDILFLVTLIVLSESIHTVDWSGVDKVLTDAINARTFPGAVLGVATSK
jgi:hypothetical protein